jgi:predicted secreted protein
MQVALLQLGQSPDFRRAATFAKQAKNVPVSFRIRQFQRFRPLIVRHFATRLRGGVAADELMEGLTELVTALGLADYEADYIRREAEPQIRPRAEVRPAYAQQARQLQIEHDQRVESIRNLPGIAAELREQLMEQEEQRFRERMLALGNADGEQANP